MTEDNERKDVSNSTVAVLLVLTILVTVVGTWLVLDALIGAAAAPRAPDVPQDTARVSLTIVDAPVETQTANIGLEFATPPEE